MYTILLHNCLQSCSWQSSTVRKSNWQNMDRSQINISINYMIFTKTYRSRVMWSCQIILILRSESTARRTDRRGRRSLQYKIPFRHDSCQRSKDFATREAPKMRFVNRNNACKKASALFLWHRRRKEKALQKESAVRGSFAACGRRPKALPSATASL